jgi:hypothetical protein
MKDTEYSTNTLTRYIAVMKKAKAKEIQDKRRGLSHRGMLSQRYGCDVADG